MKRNKRNMKMKTNPNEQFRCPVCKGKMVWYVDTLLCLNCDWTVVSMLRFEYDYKKRMEGEKR